MTAPAIRTTYDERYSDIERIDTSDDQRSSSRKPKVSEIGSDTTFHRGMGETGTRVLLVDFGSLKSADSADCADGSSDMTPSVHDGCPRCGESEMVLSLGLNPEGYDDAAFYCTNLKCPHFVGSEVEYFVDTLHRRSGNGDVAEDMTRIRADHPEEWDNTAICPECDSRFTTTLTKGVHSTHEYQDGGDSGILVDVLCDDCSPSLDREVEA